jgi:hypothetical protein
MAGWWPLTWKPKDPQWSETSVDWPTAKVTSNGKTVWVDNCAEDEPPMGGCYYVGLKRSWQGSYDQLELPHDEALLCAFLHEYFDHADKDEWPSDFWRRRRVE